MNIRARSGEELLLRSEVGSVGCYDALRVEHHHILHLGTESHIELGAADGSGTGTIHHDFHLGNVLASHLKRVLESGSRDDGSAVLVVVHHRNVEGLLQSLLDVEAFRGLDVLKVDAAESWGNLLYGLAELLGVFLCHLDVEHVDASIYLKQETLALHYRLAAHGTYVSQAENGSTIGDDSHEIALVGVLVHVVGVLLYFQTRKGHAR